MFLCPEIFISSTFDDLEAERREIIKAVLMAGAFPVCMENFPPKDKSSQMPFIKEKIEKSDLFLLVLKTEYGTVDPDTNKSITYIEYEYAKTAGKQILAFLYSDYQKKISKKSSTTIPELDKFYTIVNEKDSPVFWKNPAELIIQVNSGIVEHFKSHLPNSITETSYITDLTNIIDKMGNDIKETFGKMSKYGSKNTIEFDVWRFLGSLGQLSIPINISLQVLDRLKTTLTARRLRGKELTTSDIKKSVITILYGLVRSYDDHKFLSWVGDYTRRYGSIDNESRINCLVKVDQEQYEYKNITHEFIRTHFLPKLFNSLYSSSDGKRQLESISSNEINRMCDVIHERLSGLMLYTLHEDTIDYICYDLAIQPPHPWAVRLGSDRRIKMLNYQHDNARKHHQFICDTFSLIPDLSDAKKGELLMRINDSLHHIAAGILSAYELFIGSREQSPLANLCVFLNQYLLHNGQIKRGTAIPAFEKHVNLLKNDLVILQKYSMQDIIKIHKTAKNIMNAFPELYKAVKDMCTPENADKIREFGKRYHILYDFSVTVYAQKTNHGK